MGWGWDLPLLIQFYNRNNAKIRAQSKENEGTEFQVSLKK